MARLSTSQTKTTPFTPVQAGLLQKKCVSCGQHTIAGGECERCTKTKVNLQRKLTIGASNDQLELEADRVADQVMPASPSSVVNSSPPRIQRFTGQTAGQADMVAPASVDSVLSSPGSPLDTGLQEDMGQRFGHDFSRVRVHTDAAAEQSARDVNANAYTVGHDIVFGKGRFAPRTHSGRRLIAHELTHVVQQPEGIKRKLFSDRPDWASIPIDYEMINDPIERMEMMKADYEKYRWKNALERLEKGELDDTDLKYESLKTRLTGLKTSQVSDLISKIKAFQAQRNKDINDPSVKDPEKKRQITTVDIIQWLEVRKVISTPMPDNATVNFLIPGMVDSYSISVNDIDITVIPDTRGGGRNETKPTANFTGSFTWLEVGGKITALKKNGLPFNPTKLEVTILTKYKNSPDDTSGYGKGTTDSDKSNKTTTLRVHEGQHGTDFFSYLTNTPLPVSLKGGVNGKLTPAQFSEILKYVKNITKDTCETTDQTGFSQDEFIKTPSGQASGITSCRKP
jgi:Domain of unknown function (DUF4157)